MLTIKSKSLFGLKYDIIQDRRVGQFKIPFTRLVPSLMFGDISFNIGSNQFNVIVPLKGNKQIGFVASGYKLVMDDNELATTEFPARGSKEQLRINWNERYITFSKSGDKEQVYLDGVLMGSIYKLDGRKNTDAIDVEGEMPIEIQVFAYFAYKKYNQLS